MFLFICELVFQTYGALSDCIRGN